MTLTKELDEIKEKLMREGELLPDRTPAVAVDTPGDPLLCYKRGGGNLTGSSGEMPAKRRKLGGGRNGVASLEDLILVLYTDGAAKTERSRSLQKMGGYHGWPPEKEERHQQHARSCPPPPN